MKRIYFAFAAAALALNCAAEWRLTSYAGNSGERARPVLFGERSPRAPHGNLVPAGPVFDPATGLLYQTAGDGILNAYTLDGRLEAAYSIPKGYFSPSGDPLTRCGDKLLFKRNGELWELPMNAPDGTAAKKTAYPHKNIATLTCSARNGKILLLHQDGTLRSFEPATGKEEAFGKLPDGKCSALDWNAEGVLYAFFNKEARKIENGKYVEGPGWPKTVIGHGHPVLNGRFVGDYFYASGFGSTVVRLNGKTLDADPGVIFGGGGGHFIGYVFCDRDVTIPGGFAEIGNGVFAVGGDDGVIVLGKWNAVAGKLERMRRIGALPRVSVMELDGSGRVLAGRSFWNQNDSELAPIAGSVGIDPSACVRVGADEVVAFGKVYVDQFAVTTGKFEDERRPRFHDQKLKNLPKMVGAAIYGRDRKKFALLLDRSGAIQRGELFYTVHTVDFKTLDPVELRTAQPVKAYSGLIGINDKKLAALGDGKLILFEPDGDHWKESSRWQASFEPEALISVDGERIVISERAKNKVGIYDLNGKELSSLTVEAPGAAALNGKRLAVHETKAQRVAKYTEAQ